VALVCAAGAAAAVVPALSASADSPSSAAFEATDFSWHVAGDPSSMSAQIATDGTVTFAYPDGASVHNVDFVSGPATPSCSLNGASPVASMRVPSVPTAHGWTASCTFETPGTYRFRCDAHATMMGTIVVGDASTTPTRTTTTGGTPPPGSGTGTTPGSPTPPSGGEGGDTSGGGGAGTGGMAGMPGMSGMTMGGAGGGTTGTAGKGGSPAPAKTAVLVRSLKVARTQHGTRVTGSFTLGGSAKAKLAVQVSAKGLHPGLAGKLTKTGVHPGRVTFSVPLTKAARKALARKHTLTLNLKVVVTPAHGHASTHTLALKLRR